MRAGDAESQLPMCQCCSSESHAQKRDDEKELEKELGKCWKVEITDPLLNIPLEHLIFSIEPFSPM